MTAHTWLLDRSTPGHGMCPRLRQNSFLSMEPLPSSGWSCQVCSATIPEICIPPIFLHSGLPSNFHAHPNMPALENSLQELRPSIGVHAIDLRACKVKLQTCFAELTCGRDTSLCSIDVSFSIKLRTGFVKYIGHGLCSPDPLVRREHPHQRRVRPAQAGSA